MTNDQIFGQIHHGQKFLKFEQCQILETWIQGNSYTELLRIKTGIKTLQSNLAFSAKHLHIPPTSNFPS